MLRCVILCWGVRIDRHVLAIDKTSRGMSFLHQHRTNTPLLKYALSGSWFFGSIVSDHPVDHVACRSPSSSLHLVVASIHAQLWVNPIDNSNHSFCSYRSPFIPTISVFISIWVLYGFDLGFRINLGYSKLIQKWEKEEGFEEDKKIIIIINRKGDFVWNNWCERRTN